MSPVDQSPELTTVPATEVAPDVPAAPPAVQVFSRREVSHAIEGAITRASSCGKSEGKLVVTFDAAGTVRSAGFMRFSGDATQRTCLLGILAQMKISPFVGETVTVRKSFHVRETGTQTNVVRIGYQDA